MNDDERDPYSLLGVERRASAFDISRAYRRAARSTHPDNRPGDPSAADRFRAVTAAYETLSDPRRRAAWDRAHPVARPDASGGVRVAAQGRRLTVRVELNGRTIGTDNAFGDVLRRFRRR